MLLKTDSADLMLLALIAILLLAALAYIAIGKFRGSRERRDIRAISAALTEYFRKSGVKVSVDCVGLPGTRRFTAFIESEPMKRFRLSHIIEMTLREQVHKACGLELEKVYWRFPITEATREASAAAGAANVANGTGTTAAAGQSEPVESADDYINEGLVHYRDLPKFEVTELPWETFQQAATSESEKKEKTGE